MTRNHSLFLLLLILLMVSFALDEGGTISRIAQNSPGEPPPASVAPHALPSAATEPPPNPWAAEPGSTTGPSALPGEPEPRPELLAPRVE